MVGMIGHLALAAPLTLIVLFLPASAQEIEPRATLKNATQDDLQLNATGDGELADRADRIDRTGPAFKCAASRNVAVPHAGKPSPA